MDALDIKVEVQPAPNKSLSESLGGSSMASQLSNDAEELRLLYQVTVSDLSYFKAQQWSVAYYCFLIDAGLIGVAQLLLPLLLTDKIVLSGLLVAATGAALFVLSKLQKSISIRQSRLEATRAGFGTAFARAWSAEHKDTERVHSIYLLNGGIVLTSLLSLWLINVRLAGA